MDYIYAVVNILLIAVLVWREERNRKERVFHLDMIDRLQNKLMARDLTEYTQQSRPSKPTGVTNPIMDRIRKNQAERIGMQVIEDE